VTVTITLKITPEQQATLARVRHCERYEVGTVILDPFIRQAVTDAFDRVNAQTKRKVPAVAATMTITRKRKS
jgi:hypothetical protein